MIVFLRRAVMATTLVTVIVIIGHAQSRPKFDAFEVATIKPAGLDGPFAQGRWIRMESANRFVAHNHAVRRAS